MILRLRGRRSFRRLTTDGTRVRSSALWSICCPNPTSSSTEVAFSIPRSLGPAVARNRLRRRLRELLREIDAEQPLPPALLLIGATPRTIELTFDQLRRDLMVMIEAIRRRCSDGC